MVLGDAVGLYYLVALCGGLPGSRVLGVVIVVGVVVMVISVVLFVVVWICGWFVLVGYCWTLTG